VLVVAVTGGPDPATLGTLPANVRAEAFVPFGALMEHVSLMVTNGGYGGTHFAMSHGVPLVVAGTSEDKAEIVARVNWSVRPCHRRRSGVPRVRHSRRKSPPRLPRRFEARPLSAVTRDPPG
jgi:Erythromycin biosynthesis protein CIII-like, C-terminal domain